MLVKNGISRLSLVATGIVYSLALWLVSILLFIQSSSTTEAWIFAKTYYITAMIIVALLALFAILVKGDYRQNTRFVVYVTISVMTIFALLTTFLPGFIVTKVVIGSTGNYIVADSFSYLLYSAYFIAMLVFSAITILGTIMKAKHKQKIQLLVFLAGCLLMATPGIIADILLPYSQNYHLAWFGFVAVVALMGLVGYILSKRTMFDLRLAAVRTLAYVLSLAFLIVIYYSLATTISNVFSINGVVDQGTIGMILAFGLLLIFQPVKSFFDKLTGDVLYRDNYNTDELFSRINRTLTSTSDLRLMLERVSLEIATTFKSRQVFFFIETDQGRHISAGTFKHVVLPVDDVRFVFENSEIHSKVIIANKLKPFSPLRRLMVSHNIELIVKLQQLGVNGLICLGEHLNTGYKSRDVNVLSALSDEIVIAIQNNLSIQQVRDVNETLQQRIANATRELRSRNATLSELDKAKDEFVSMASHQLRTPLTSVKGYISMVLEGDAGAITPTQKQFLEEAYMSSERMVSLINDFLNVSRLQTGKFMVEKHQVDLAKVVEQEVDGLLPNARARKLKLKYKKPKTFPIMELDEGKIRQVIMNFTDNAIYYSHENTTINVSLEIKKDRVVFMVKDTGIGVPKAEQDRLFDKFFRATNARTARPDGTGVGLFLAKKVIDAHGGELIFKSIEGKGSTFGFSLPIKSA